MKQQFLFRPYVWLAVSLVTLILVYILGLQLLLHAYDQAVVVLQHAFHQTEVKLSFP